MIRVFTTLADAYTKEGGITGAAKGAAIGAFMGAGKVIKMGWKLGSLNTLTFTLYPVALPIAASIGLVAGAIYGFQKK